MLLKKKSYHITPSVKTVQWLFPSKTKIKFFAVSVQQGHTWSALLFSSYLFSYNSPCPCLCTSHWIPCPSTGALGSPCLRGLDFFLLNDPSIWDAYPSDAQVTTSFSFLRSLLLCHFLTLVYPDHRSVPHMPVVQHWIYLPLLCFIFFYQCLLPSNILYSWLIMPTIFLTLRILAPQG